MKRILCLFLLAALLLTTGCSSLLERSYASITPHRQFSDEKENPSILGRRPTRAWSAPCSTWWARGRRTG